MDFLPLDIVTKSGLKYEVSKDGIVRSVTKNGAIKILKLKGNRVSIVGEMKSVSDLIRDAGWLSITETKSEDPDTNEEIFESIRKGYQYEIFISTWGRLKHIFRNGYIVIKTVEEMFNDLPDACLRIVFNNSRVNINNVVVNVFIGEVPDGFRVCNTDGAKMIVRLGNLRLIENTKHSHENDVVSVASFINKKHEKTHATKESAIFHVINNGYSNATVEELEASLQRMADYNIPAVLYDRTWIYVN